MTTFRYDAIGSEGRVRSGTIDASTRREALQLLTQQGLHASSLVATSNGHRHTGGQSTSSRIPSVANVDPGLESAVAPRVAAASSATPSPKISKPTSVVSSTQTSNTTPTTGRISSKDVTAFTRQMASLLKATIPIPQALAGLAEQEESAALRAVLTDLATSVRMGESFSASLNRYPKLFPTLYVSMIEVGEESGKLDQVLEDMADLLERQDEMRGEVVSAIAYPAFVLGMGIVTTFVLLTFVMPRLFKMLSDMIDVLPLPTRILLSTSSFLQNYWYTVVIALVAIGLLWRQYLRRAEGRRSWDSLKLKLPVVGPLLRAAALSRFARTLSTLEGSGVSLLPSLEIVKNTVGNVVITEAIDSVAEETRGGSTLAGPLRALGLFPPTMVQMIAVGEETGQLAAMLGRVADIQEKHVRRGAQTLVSLLAPILILIVGALVGFIVISMLLPIFSMSQGLK